MNSIVLILLGVVLGVVIGCLIPCVFLIKKAKAAGMVVH